MGGYTDEARQMVAAAVLDILSQKQDHAGVSLAYTPLFDQSIGVWHVVTHSVDIPPLALYIC